LSFQKKSILMIDCQAGLSRRLPRNKFATGEVAMFNTLLYEIEGEVGILTYNRPKVVNALNKQMIEELYDFWWARQRDFDTRVIIVQGAGEKGFYSGLDMKAVVTEFAPPEGATAESTFDGQIHFSVLMRLMRSCPQPIIAAVHGPAMGAGLSFALASDIRLASEDAFFCAQAGEKPWVLN
jgi:enoyl-CoA hydratase/carnithine racemase